MHLRKPPRVPTSSTWAHQYFKLWINWWEISKDLDQLRPFIATGILNKKHGKKRVGTSIFGEPPIQAKIIFEFLSNSYFSETFLVNFKRWGMGKQNSNGSLHFNSWTCSFRETSQDLGPPSLHFSIILNLSSEGIHLEGLAPIKSSLQLLHLGEFKRGPTKSSLMHKPGRWGVTWTDLEPPS